jgi:predicted DNA binding protein
MDRTNNPEARDATRVLGVPEQETLRVALEKGYFEIPRATTLADVADELGRSDVEVSQQIRRGMGIVLRTTDVLDTPSP